MQQQEIAYLEKLESFMEQSKQAKEDQLQEKLVENQNKQIELQQQLQEHQNRLLDEQQKYQQRYDELHSLQRQIEDGRQQQLDVSNNVGGQYDPVANNRIIVKDTETQTPREGESNNAEQLNDSFFNLSTRFDEADQNNLKKNDYADGRETEENDDHNQHYDNDCGLDEDTNSRDDGDFFQDQQHSDERMSDRHSERLSNLDSHGDGAIEAAFSDDTKLGEQTEFYDADSQNLHESNNQDAQEAALLNEILPNQADVVVMDQEEPAIIVHENGRGYLICKIVLHFFIISAVTKLDDSLII